MRPTETPAIFESLLSDIMQGRVDEPDRVAFVLTDGKPHQKASIRYGVCLCALMRRHCVATQHRPQINSLDDVGKARQKNMHYANGPATRAILAKLIAEHIQLCMVLSPVLSRTLCFVVTALHILQAAAKQRGMPLMFPEGNELEFDQLVLIEVRWVTTGSIQPVLGYSPLAVVP